MKSKVPSSRILSVYPVIQSATRVVGGRGPQHFPFKLKGKVLGSPPRRCVTMHQVRLSVTESNPTIPEGLKDWFIQHNCTLIVRENPHDEDGEKANVHFHLACDGKYGTIKKQVLKYGYKGNKEYSVQSVPIKDMPSVLRYYCKGLNKLKDSVVDVVYNIGHDIPTLHDAYWVQNEVLQDVKKEQRKKSQSVTEDIMKVLKDKEFTQYGYKDKLIAQIVLWFLRENRKLPSVFEMDRIWSTIYARHEAGDLEEVTEDELLTITERIYGKIIRKKGVF